MPPCAATSSYHAAFGGTAVPDKAHTTAKKGILRIPMNHSSLHSETALRSSLNFGSTGEKLKHWGKVALVVGAVAGAAYVLFGGCAAAPIAPH